MTTLTTTAAVIPGSATERPANRQAHLLTGRPYLSFSQITLMRSCPKKFSLHYVEHARPDFITASLIFCIGPMTILGSLQNGLMGDYSLLTVKSVLDGFAAMALAASLGAGVILSAGTVLAYQGGLSLLAMLFATALGGVTRTTPWVIEMTATGGVVILSIAFILLDIKRIRTANLLPAIFIAPLIVVVFALLEVSL